MESIIEKLKKIQTLAERGCNGEMENAKFLLDKLLKQYNLTLEDLSSEIRKERVFKNCNAAVFIMCSYKIFGVKRTKTSYNYKNKPKDLCIELTDLEYIEISEFYNFHKRNFDKEFQKMKVDFQCSYQLKHELYTEKNDSDDKGKSYSQEELEKLLTYASMMEDVAFHKAIEK
ncbi:MAG: hypothetical protein LBN27_02075 [Prevotellaceae bacterium]|jgi:hypothetical protein|nr:hypothetical protein [Prevotellaceae bacterium]